MRAPAPVPTPPSLTMLPQSNQVFTAAQLGTVYADYRCDRTRWETSCEYLRVSNGTDC